MTVARPICDKNTLTMHQQAVTMFYIYNRILYNIIFSRLFDAVQIETFKKVGQITQKVGFMANFQFYSKK